MATGLGVAVATGFGVAVAAGLGVAVAAGLGVAVAAGLVVVVDVAVGLGVVVEPDAVGFTVGVWLDCLVGVGADDEGDVVRVGDTCVPVTAGTVGNDVVAPDVGDRVAPAVGSDDGAFVDGVFGGGVARTPDVTLGIVPGSLLPEGVVDSDGMSRQATAKAAMHNRIMDMANSRTAKRFGERRARDK